MANLWARWPGKVRSASALAVLALGAGFSAAQEGGYSSFLDRVEVRVLNVDVVVLDATGTPWRGLTREDFEILENGEPVEISNFAAYDRGVALEPETGEERPEPAAATAPEPAALAPPPVTWVVYIDQSRLEPGRRNLALRETRDFLDRARRATELAMVATWDSHRLRVVSQLSTDRHALDSALTDLQREATGASLSRAHAEQLGRDILSVGGLTSSTGEESAFVSASEFDAAFAEELRQEIAFEAEERANETARALEGFRDLLGLIDGIDGRVILLFAGGGFELDPGDRLLDLWSTRFASSARATVSSGTGRRVAELAEEYLRVLQELNGARVTVHTIFAGAAKGPDVGADRSFSAVDVASVTSAGDEVATAASMRAFAEETGGHAFQGSTQLEENLEAVRRDLGYYYSLGYHPRGESPRGLRKIEVRVRREGAQVLHRTGLVERTPEERAESAALAALLQPETAASTSLRIETFEPRDAPRGRRRVMPVRIALPMREVALLPAGEKHQGKLLYHFALATPEGAFLSFEPRRLEFEVPNESLAKALASPVTYQVDLPLEPGSYRLGVTVQDELAGSYFTLVTPIEMPRAR